MNTLEFEMPTEQPEGVVSWAKVAHLIRNLGKRKNFPSSSDSKESACNAGATRDTGSIPVSGRSLEKGMATHSSILVWKIPWAEEPGGLQSMGLPRVRHN